AMSVAQLERDGAEGSCLAAASLAEAAAAATLSAARETERCTVELINLRGEEDSVRTMSKEVEDSYESTRDSWLSSLASTIASELVDHAPCPVCGSEDHPAPAPPVLGHATGEQVEELNTKRMRSFEQLQKAIAASNMKAARIEELSAGANGLNSAQAEQVHAGAAELVGTALAARRRAEEVSRGLDGLRADQKNESDQIVVLGNRLATLAEQCRLQRESLEESKARLTLSCAGYGSVAKRVQALRDRARIAGELAAAQRAICAAERSMTTRADALAGVIRASGFQTAADARGALMSQEAREAVREDINAHRQDCAVVDEGLRSTRIASVKNAIAQDTGLYERAKEGAEADLQLLTLAHGELKQSISASRQASAAMRSAIAFQDQTSRQALPVVRMSEVVNAQQGNEMRTSLPTFVLLRRFEEVVALANARLNAMTGGRFELHRTDAKEGRGMKLGLGLEVIDHASSDATREPQTLSGGETFKASLAMALGLADAVTAEAGGVELSTLFIDEGFGSLDSVSLDSVMDQLTKLRQGGRSVGVISHVAEMKQRIAERVSVRPVGDGTSGLTVVGSCLGIETS
ncbi:MAG TPA: SbcC/MukB-like Walker B domain-containing protein, partial [Anaerolineae bacterium]|nr:SbcC/MukB-like Walker B domain-containing protein [Anaerolineae bacterium]